MLLFLIKQIINQIFQQSASSEGEQINVSKQNNQHESGMRLKYRLFLFVFALNAVCEIELASDKHILSHFMA